MISQRVQNVVFEAAQSRQILFLRSRMRLKESAQPGDFLVGEAASKGVDCVQAQIDSRLRIQYDASLGRCDNPQTSLEE